MTPEKLAQLAVTLYEIGAVRLGRFTLHSGVVSPIYIDLRLLVSFPDALRQVAQAYIALLDNLHFDILAAYPYAALPIGTAISLETSIPLIYPRKTAKGYGTGKQVEGVWEVGQTALVVEDLITSGDSILQAIASLKAASLQVRDAVVLIDREQGGRAALQAQGYTVHAVMTMRQLLATLETEGRISARERAKVLKQLAD
ncbi:MAG: orotate phosphoribosyltransferase [Anaerolineae bacterium]|nr:orotate phosphoribosyltransferase [Anaerolineae bacterium]